jgi:hypothetical protein
VPLQEDFTKPTGWLGMLVGTKLWCNCFDGTDSERLMNVMKLVKQEKTKPKAAASAESLRGLPRS